MNAYLFYCLLTVLCRDAVNEQNIRYQWARIAEGTLHTQWLKYEPFLLSIF